MEATYRNTQEAVDILNAAGVPAYNYHSGGGVMLATVNLHTAPQVVDGRETIYDGPWMWIHDSSEQGETEGRWSVGFYKNEGDDGLLSHNLTDGQLVAFARQARVYFTDDAPNCDGLAYARAGTDVPMVEGELAPGEIAAEFRYIYDDGSTPGERLRPRVNGSPRPPRPTGLEITIYDADGDVMESQDFG